MADRFEADADAVMRMVSGSSGAQRVPHPGLGDGGACRPRDLVVLDALSEDPAKDRHTLFGDLLRNRMDHAEWLAEFIFSVHLEHLDLPVVMIGEAYKPDVPYTDGSPAVLLRNLLSHFRTASQPGEMSVPLHVGVWDPVTQNDPHPPRAAALYVYAVPHTQVIQTWAREIPDRSVVVDINGALNGWQQTVRVLIPGRLS